MSSEISEVQADMFTLFIQRLESEGIDYVLLGRVDQYPEKIDSDVDFLVHPRDADRLHKLLVRPNAIPNALLLQFLKHEISATYYIFARVSAEHEVVCFHPDLTTDYRRSGRLLMSAESLLLNRRRDSSQKFWIPGPGQSFEYYLIKRIDKMSLGVEHIEYLRRLYSDAGEDAKPILRRLWPKSCGLIEKSLIDKDCDLMMSRIEELRLEMRSNTLRESRSRRCMIAIRNGGRLLNRLRAPAGIIVVVAGGGSCQTINNILLTRAGIKDAFRGVEVLPLTATSLLSVCRIALKVLVAKWRSQLVLLTTDSLLHPLGKNLIRCADLIQFDDVQIAGSIAATLHSRVMRLRT